MRIDLIFSDLTISHYDKSLFWSRLYRSSRITANRRRRRRRRRLLINCFFCFLFSLSIAHTRRFSRWMTISCLKRFRAIFVCATMSSRPPSSRSRPLLMLAITSSNRPSRLRVSSVCRLPSRRPVRPTTIISTVRPSSRPRCIDGDVISREYSNTPLALSSHHAWCPKCWPSPLRGEMQRWWSNGPCRSERQNCRTWQLLRRAIYSKTISWRRRNRKLSR